MPLQRTLLRPVPGHQRFLCHLFHKTMQNIRHFHLQSYTYRFLPISISCQTLLFYSSARTSSCHKTCLPYVHPDYRYPLCIQDHNRRDDKFFPHHSHKKESEIFDLFYFLFPFSHIRLIRIYLDKFLCKRLLFHLYLIPLLLRWSDRLQSISEGTDTGRQSATWSIR